MYALETFCAQLARTYSSQLITRNLRYIGCHRILSSLEQKRGMSLLLVHYHGQLRFGWQSE